MKLEGINAVITGANQGLGLEMAEAFVREGATVFICARDSVKLAEAAERLGKIRGQQFVKTRCLDVSSDVEVAAFTAEAIKTLGRIHVLVNNAGVYGPKGPTEEVDADLWRKAVEINLMGVFYVCRHFIPHMKASGGGKIINLSGGGATAPLPRISAYAASKAAVVRLSETLAEELREFHIDVNAIAPGALNTRMLDEVLAAGPEKVGQAFYSKALKQKESGGAPLDKGAALAVYLASSESDGITGKLVSAVWDPWPFDSERKTDISSSDIYTLRRIVPQERGKKWS